MTESAKRSRTWRAGMLVALCLSGCAAVDAAPDAPASERALLSPFTVLSGAPLHAAPGPALNGLVRPPAPAPATAAPSYLTLLAPTVVAARDNTIFIADSGHRKLLRYDAAFAALSRFADFPAAGVSAMAVAPDMSLYVTDAGNGRVQHFSWDGRLLQSLDSDTALSRPVGMLLDETGAQVLVADGLYNHVVIFNALGRPVGTLKSQRAHSLAAMAGGPDGLYLLDRLAREVVVLGLDGADRYAFGSAILKDPSGLAVDRFNRVYVGDAFDNSIKVFAGGELAASYGAGSGGISFGRIASLFIERDMLYVADSINRRVQVFRIAPPAPAAAPHE